jgi:hypothetical protein
MKSSGINSYLIFAAAILNACATSGTEQKLIGEKTWSVYVWDGDICNANVPGKDDPKCVKLIPKMEENAKRVCGELKAEIKDCETRERSTGTRLFCTVFCRS